MSNSSQQKKRGGKERQKMANGPSLWILGTEHKLDNPNTELAKHIKSLLSFTYRRDFPPFKNYEDITSDSGWGCMLRSAQMLMANTLQRHFLGKGWRAPNDFGARRGNPHYCQILKLFMDFPGSPDHMYAIHHIAQGGFTYDKIPGEWFGPSTAALVLRDLARIHRRWYGGAVEILVTQGDIIYSEPFYQHGSEVEKICGAEVEVSGGALMLANSIAEPHEGGIPGVATAIATGVENIETRAQTLQAGDLRLQGRPEGGPQGGPQGISTGSRADNSSGSEALSDGGVEEIHTSATASSEQATRRVVLEPEGPANLEMATQAANAAVAALGVETKAKEQKGLEVAPGFHNSKSAATPPDPENDHSKLEREQQRDHEEDSSSRSVSGKASETPAGGAATEPVKSPPVVEGGVGDGGCGVVAERVRQLLRERAEERALRDTEGDRFFDPLLHPPPPEEQQPWLCSLLVLLPLRLGIHGINPEYVEELKEFMRHPNCVGFIGGWPQHALYFAGYRDQQTFLGIDPHTTYPTPPRPPSETPGAEEARGSAVFPSIELCQQVHVSELEPVDVTRLDPSLALGLYFRNREEFDAFFDEAKRSNAAKVAAGRTPLYAVEHMAPAYATFDEDDDDASGLGNEQIGSQDDDDEYVLV